MSSSFAGIEMGKRGLMAHSQAINTAGHNISNADTEGYSRQRVELRQYSPLYRPDLERAETAGQIGQGVVAERIARVRDEMLDGRIVAQANQESYWETRESYYAMLEAVYNEPADISVRSNMDKFWESWQELSLFPETKAARQAVVTRGETLAESIRQRHTSLAGIGTLLNSDIEATVTQVNGYAARIAELNTEITKSEAMGDNPNDLYDQRDLLVEKLSKLVNITRDTRDNDEFMVHVDGRILVQGGIARQFDVEPTIDNNGYSKVVWSDTKNPAEISGGKLGALIELRDVDVRHELQSLNTLTMNFMDLVNDIHRNAIGANNVTGLDFFVEQPFVNNALGNYDRNGDGREDSSYIFRITGTNSLKAQEQIGIEGSIKIAGKDGIKEIPYYAADTVETVINRINDSDGEVKAYLDRNNNLVLKGTTALNQENPDFVIRHLEDDGYFLTGYAGVLSSSGRGGAFDFNEVNAVSKLAGAQYTVSPVLNPAGYMEVNAAIKADVLSVAAAKKGSTGVAELGDSSAAVEIAALRNTTVMIDRAGSFDDYFADSVTNVGLKGEQAELNYKNQTAIMDDLRGLRDSISGVNMDEELADIIKFQHGYNAAAKIVTVMDELINTVLKLGV
ncbi:MAG: flagellar hook-associated protein FlgK [Treponemataceae bacterium]|nr:flagellar hook-associated protein FlgK [Treponemataceae bacterium]